MWGTTGIHRSGRFCTITWFYLDVLICLDHQRGICVSHLMRNIAAFHYCCYSTMLWMCQGVANSIKSQILWWVFNAAHSLVPNFLFSWRRWQGIWAWSALPVVSRMSSGAFSPGALGACSVYAHIKLKYSFFSFHLVGACWLWDGSVHVIQLHWEAIASLSMLHRGPTAALELWLCDQACTVPLVTPTRWMIICFIWWGGFPLCFRAFFHFDHMIGLCLATCQQKW